MNELTEIYINRFQRKNKTERMIIFFEMLVGATQKNDKDLVNAVLSRTKSGWTQKQIENESRVFDVINSDCVIDNSKLFDLYQYSVMTLCVILSHNQRIKIYELARKYKRDLRDGMMNIFLHNEYVSKIRLMKNE